MQRPQTSLERTHTVGLTPPEPIPKPEHGALTLFTPRPCVAPLAIEAAPDADFFIKLVERPLGITTLTAFIHRGRTLELEVPTGSYDLRFATGWNWYGDELLFGQDTSYSKADTALHFKTDAYGISGYRVMLERVVGGNLSTSPIKAAEF